MARLFTQACVAGDGRTEIATYFESDAGYVDRIDFGAEYHVASATALAVLASLVNFKIEIKPVRTPT